MLGTLKDLTMNRDGSQNLTITLKSDFREMFDTLADKDVEVQIKKASKHRSMDANAYLWHLCGEIAKASSKYSTDGKEDVYRDAIRAKGEYEPLMMKEQAVDKFAKRWSQKGLGWFVDIVDDYTPDDIYFSEFGDDGSTYKMINAHYGSSTYDSLSMSRVIDWLVNIANDLGIPTMTDNEADKLLSAWAKKKEKDNG